MKYRQINTDFWEDNYILDLSDKEKIYFCYLFTNPRVNMVGIYEISDRIICATLGATLADLKKMQSKFEKDSKYYFYNNWVFINNFTKHNRYSSVKNVVDAFLTDFNSIPQEVLKHFLVKLKLLYTPPLVKKDKATDKVTVIIKVMVMDKYGSPYPRIQAESTLEEKLNINEIPEL